MLVARIDVRPDSVDIHLLPSRLAPVLADSPPDLPKPNLQSPTTTLSVRVQLQRTGMEMRLLIEGEHAREPDTGLIKLLIKARAYAEQLASGSAQSLEVIATREQVTRSYVTRVLRVAFVAPDIAAAILRGHHPPQLNTARLLANSRLALTWSRQRDALGFL
jgi:site-specific DNA recombinase